MREKKQEKLLKTDGSIKKLNRKLAHLLMIITVISWGFEYSLAKEAMLALDSITLIFFKYAIAMIVVGIIKFKREGKSFMRRSDIWIFILCAITGEILYFYFEYEAMTYMPVSLITIVLTFVPVVSVVVEWLVYHKAPTVALLIGIFISIGGLGMIIGLNLHTILQGRLIGYLLCVGAIVSWNIYNFITSHLGGKYQPLTLTFNQLACTVLLSFPIAMAHLPTPSEITLAIAGEVLYLGVISGGIGFYVYVTALSSLGPTTVSVYANFMPISATFFGWLLLGEMITGIQMIGGIIVISAGFFVIREKGRLEGTLHV